ncbi:MAG: 3',5'-cyclic-AMP phosphodiesterase [Pseudohongiella sp.]|uniref:3',5'-cyclic-AMP phosphodiesterase n=1 Tax=Pseudohongiella sp. TaxID=1979412 RepID=UPI0034A088A0
MQKPSGEYRAKPLRLLQITDTHLFRNPDAALLGLNTQDSFVRVVDLIARQQPEPDWIVATGDIAQDASSEAYQRFADTMARIPAPFSWIPGNHDRRSGMLSTPAFKAAFVERVQLANWQIIMLDTAVPGEVHGLLSAHELAHLEASLASVANDDTLMHTLVCLHHNPVPGTASWMQDIGLHNADALIEILQRHDHVRGIVYGHIHQTLDFEAHGLRFFCTPSTCIQFKPGVEDFALDLRSPAYRWFDLHPDGRIETQVERLQDYEVKVDEQAGGY